MNTCFFTAQIASRPKQYMSRKRKKVTIFILRIPNPKKGTPFYYITAISRGEPGKSLLNWYSKGDYLIIEGGLLCFSRSNSRGEVIRIMQVNILKEFPTSLEL
jgi:hypothetical protein